ncbi:hypothetical protein NDU88_008114 [Pleurodeles waltl]|uniref:Uncharacterized protein n=1 Tax=Pleurodeles waltl TaxID=8319 RepID=A0AAV7VU82_PLEWA|nr:hypothetical protein NDU88_008114 [Pleurodeles waltl]
MASKQPGKPSWQLLFSEALRNQRAPPAGEYPLIPTSSMEDTTRGTTMDCILQEISAVGRKLEGMDSAMASLMAGMKSMPLDIAGFHDRRRAFLALRPRLRQLDVKGLFELARMWITKNGVSRVFYDLEDLQVFLEGLQNQTQSMEMATLIRTQDMLAPLLSVVPSTPAPEVVGQTTADSHPRGRDLERLTKSHDDRGQVLQAVVMHTQIADRDKSRSPLKPTLTPT